ncbi:MAG: hypothetical protein WBG86_00055 [Polyangiales bacterium]
MRAPGAFCHYLRMKSLTALLCALTVSVTLLLPIGAVAPGSAHAEACYELYGEVRKVGPGWAHIVVVENNCQDWMQCTLWTNVDPQPPVMLGVAPSATEKRQITADSEMKEFKTYGSCRRQ